MPLPGFKENKVPEPSPSNEAIVPREDPTLVNPEAGMHRSQSSLVQKGDKLGIPLALFPEDVVKELVEVDDGDGLLDIEELDEIFGMYVKLSEANDTGEMNIELVPKEIQPVLKKFDTDGDGTISVEELSKAADLYEQSLRTTARLLKIVFGLLVLLVLTIVGIGILTYMVIELAKTTALDPSGLATVKDGGAYVSAAAVTNSKTLFDMHTVGIPELEAVDSLSLQSQDGTQYFGYTITGFLKEQDVGAVTFFSSRGDQILCTAATVTVTERCTPPNPTDPPCVGRQVLQLRKSDIANARRLAQERLNELKESGRRLSSADMRRLQSQASVRNPRSNIAANANPNALNRQEMCPDGTFKIGGQCPETCVDNMPLSCPGPDYVPELVWMPNGCYSVSAGLVAPATGTFTSYDETLKDVQVSVGALAPKSGIFCVSAGDGPPLSILARTIQDTVERRDWSTLECECPTKCPDGEEACYLREDGNMYCDQIRMPFKPGLTPCVKKCPAGQWRDSNSGKCMTTCGDPNKTEVLASEQATKCAVKCPDLRDTAKAIGEDSTSLLGLTYMPDWIAPTADVPASQVVSVLCPRLCIKVTSRGKVGHLAYYPNQRCPRRCTGSNGEPITVGGEPVYANAGEECPRVCPTGAVRSSDKACPLLCPDQANAPITDPSTGAPEEFQYYGADWKSLNTAEIRARVCPKVCTDGTIQRFGSCPEDIVDTPVAPFRDCLGAPKDCDGNIIQTQDEYGRDCPMECPTLRNCWLKESGLIYKDSNKSCPAPCMGANGMPLKDAFGAVTFDWGQGCPLECPLMTDGNGRRINMAYMSYGTSRRMSAETSRQSRKKNRMEAIHFHEDPGRRLEQIWVGGTMPGLAYPPVYACPVLCLNTDGSAMITTENGGRKYEYIVPVKDSWDYTTDKAIFKAMDTSNADELREMMCPRRCPDSDFVIRPVEVQDDEGFWYSSMESKSDLDCPTQCSDGRFVYPGYGETCDGGTAPKAWAGSTVSLDTI